MRDAISRARKTAVPTDAQRRAKKKTADLALDLVEQQAEGHPQVIECEFGGSYAKDTWLPKGADVDIFVKFKRRTPDEEFVRVSREIGFAALAGYNPSVRYSDHPYVEGAIRDTKINIVPCYDVARGRWKSAADRSPYHTAHMQQHLTPSMRDDVRVLKAFLGSVGIYGAEIAKRGFSGYVSEVLVLWFGSFEGVVKGIAGPGERLTVGNPTKKFGIPTVIADPIDGKRNLAAAISPENVGRFTLCCRAFQNSPRQRFLKGAATTPLKALPRNILVVRFGFTPRSPEIIWGQAKKAARELAAQMESGGFHVLRHDAYTDEKSVAGLLFLLESTRIPKIRTREGPEVFRGKNADQFIKMNMRRSKMMWVDRNRRIISLEEREFPDARTFLEHLIRGDRSGLPSGLRADFDAGFEVLCGTGRLGKSIKEAALKLVSTDGAFFHFN